MVMVHFLGTIGLAAAVAAGPIDAGVCLTGRVVDAASRPLARAAVMLVSDATGAAVVQARADAQGMFALPEVAAGSYLLVVDRFGFERSTLALELAPRQSWDDDVALTPMERYARTSGGRSELPWLVRARTGDPLRVVDERGPSVEHDYEPLGMPVQGRVAFETLTSGGGDGRRASLALNGLLGSEITWFVDGSLDAFEVHESDQTDSRGVNRLVYGIDRADLGGRLSFRGEVQRVTREMGDVVDPTSLAERRKSFRFDYATGHGEHDLGLTFAYHESVAGETDELSTDDRQRHSIWEGRGSYAQQLGANHRLRTDVRVRAQRWSTPNPAFVAVTLPLRGSILEGRQLDPSSWQLFVSESLVWDLTQPLTIEPGIDLAHGSTSAGGPFLRPRLGALLALGQSRVRVQTSWLLRDDQEQTVAPLEDGALWSAIGFQVAFERDVGDAKVRIEALRNAHMDVDDVSTAMAAQSEYVLLSTGPVQSRELRLAVQAAEFGGFRGRVGAAFGTADGDLGVLLLSPTGLGPSSPTSANGRVQYASALFGGELSATATDVTVRYQWIATEDRTLDGLEHLNVTLDQALPWRGLRGAQLALQLAFSGYLNRPTSTQTAEMRNLLPGTVLAAGVGVRF